MKTASYIKSAATGSIPLSGRLKIFLLVLAFIIIAATLCTLMILFSIKQKEKEVADLYAKSFEYIANGKQETATIIFSSQRSSMRSIFRHHDR